MTGAWVVAAAVLLAAGFGLFRHLGDGRVRTVPAATPDLDQLSLGEPLGQRATFVQFSAQVCAPCRATQRVLTELVAEESGVAHIEIDAETRMELVDRFSISRTPTVLVLDAGGAVRKRIVGGVRSQEARRALAEVVGEPVAS